MLVAALTLALPAAAALAQSAGDNQYQDPLGGGGGSSGGGNSSGGSGGGGSSTPAPHQSQSGNSGSGSSTPAPARSAPRSVPLARTGFDAVIPGVAGLVLLAGGVTLLLRSRRPTS